MNRRPFLIGLGAAMLAGCEGQSRQQPYVILGKDDEPLRRVFNEDAGKVRVLMLVSPT
jgi:hypothetical protein